MWEKKKILKIQVYQKYKLRTGSGEYRWDWAYKYEHYLKWILEMKTEKSKEK